MKFSINKKNISALLFVLVFFISFSFNTSKVYAFSFSDSITDFLTNDKEELGNIITEVLVEADLSEDALVKHIGIVDDAYDKRGQVITGAIILQIGDTLRDIKNSKNIKEAVKKVINNIKNHDEVFNEYVKQSKDMILNSEDYLNYTSDNYITKFFYSSMNSKPVKWIANVLNKTNLNVKNAGEVFKTKQKLDQEAMEAIGLEGINKNLMKGLFEFNSNYKESIENLSEDEKSILEETNMYFAYQLQPTRLGERLMNAVGSDTKLWKDLFKKNNIRTTADLEKLLENIEFKRQAINNLFNDKNNYKKIKDTAVNFDAQAIIDEASNQITLYSLGKDPDLSKKGYKFTEWAEVIKLINEYEKEFGIKYLWNPKKKEKFNFGQFGTDGKLEEIGNYNYRYFPVITKVRFTITRKNGYIGSLQLADDNKLQEVAKKYSGIGNVYKSITGRYIPKFKEIYRSYDKVVYEIDYTEGLNWDDLRLKMSPVYKKYRPAIAFNVKNEGIYVVHVNVYAKQLIEKNKKHKHTYTVYLEKDDEGNYTKTEEKTCKLTYWPYYQILKSNGDGSHYVKTSYRNIPPWKETSEVQIGYVEWEINASKGIVEIPVMGKDVTMSRFITK